VRNHATIIPFAVTELESDKAHLVMSSDDVMEPGATSVVVYEALIATAAIRAGSRSCAERNARHASIIGWMTMPHG
jgi:hypothetical protein